MTDEIIPEEPETSLEKSKRLIIEILKSDQLLDEDGYPTDSAITMIESWPWDNPDGWFSKIRELWWAPDWGWTTTVEQEVEWEKTKSYTVHSVSTGGWSGNEALIRAMESNDMLWHTTWWQSRRGGHYIFKVRGDGAV